MQTDLNSDGDVDRFHCTIFCSGRKCHSNADLIIKLGSRLPLTKVPLGRYYVRVATGESWYGLDELFGPNTHYFRLLDKRISVENEAHSLVFRSEGRTIYGHTIILKKVPDGNLEQQATSRKEFDALE